jgi:hypothetical protein
MINRTIMILISLQLIIALNTHADVTQVPFDDIGQFTDLREFGDGGDFGSSPISFGERFVGQTTTFKPVPIRPNEILSGTPVAPLQLEVTGVKEGVCRNYESEPDLGIAGLISDGAGTQVSCGEGSVAILFGQDQSQIGVRMGVGPITFQFFDRTGTGLGVFDLNVAFGTEIGFVSKSSNIAGFSFHNLKVGGAILPALYFGGDSILSVVVDIKPGGDPNCFNINGHGVIPVAVLGSDSLDVIDVDISTLSFGGLALRMRGNKGAICGYEDSNDDGMQDLVCQFEDDPSAWSVGSDSATLSGELLDGSPFEGSDSICVVP